MATKWVLAQKVGIGVSVGLGILFVITLIAWTVHKKRRNTNLLSAKTQSSRVSQTQSNDIDSNGVFNLLQTCEHCEPQSYELDHGSIRELDGLEINELNHRSLYELNAVSSLVELSVARPKTLIAGWLDAKGGFWDNVSVCLPRKMAPRHIFFGWWLRWLASLERRQEARIGGLLGLRVISQSQGFVKGLLKCERGQKGLSESKKNVSVTGIREEPCQRARIKGTLRIER